jgi:putative transposase
MPRMPRIVVKDDPAVYHVMSRVALDGYPLGDVEKEYLFETIRRLSSVYFAEVLG